MTKKNYSVHLKRDPLKLAADGKKMFSEKNNISQGITNEMLEFSDTYIT